MVESKGSLDARARVARTHKRMLDVVEAYEAELLELDRRVAEVERSAKALDLIDRGVPLPRLGARGWFYSADEREILGPVQRRRFSAEQLAAFSNWLVTSRGMGTWEHLADAVLDAAAAIGMEG